MDPAATILCLVMISSSFVILGQVPFPLFPPTLIVCTEGAQLLGSQFYQSIIWTSIHTERKKKIKKIRLHICNSLVSGDTKQTSSLLVVLLLQETQHSDITLAWLITNDSPSSSPADGSTITSETLCVNMVI